MKKNTLHTIRHNLKRYRPFFLVLLAFLLLLALLAVSVQFTQDTQDARPQALVDQGQVLIDVVPSSRPAFFTKQSSGLTFRLNTQGFSIYGVQVVMDVASNGLTPAELSALRVTVKNPSTFELISQRIDQTNNGIRIWFAVRPIKVAEPFSLTDFVDFAELDFVPSSPGQITLDFDHFFSRSTVYNDSSNDQLRTIPHMTFLIQDPASTTSVPPALPRSGNASPILWFFILGVTLVLFSVNIVVSRAK